MKKICVVGTGYVGLVSGAGLADFGNEVVCVDIAEDKISLLNEGVIPIYEPGLKELVDNNVRKNRLRFSTDIAGEIKSAQVVFIAVNTPPAANGEVDLTYVFQVVDTIAENISDYKVIATKSTVAVGTGKKIKARMLENGIDEELFDVVSNPEFLREGSAVGDFMRPDRVVLGTENEKSLEIMKDVYRPLYLIETPIISTNIETAELIKYASNAFLATKISFINEVANICERVGADIHVVAKAMGLDGRISAKFLHAGPGFGGSCFPKDTMALTKIAESVGYECEIVNAVISVNEKQKKHMVEKIIQLVPELRDKTVGILGLSFKPNTDDVRESPALVIIDELLKKGASIKAYDPAAMKEMSKHYPKITYVAESYDACKDVDILIILTEWNEFRNMNLELIKELMKSPNIVDTRNIYNPEIVRELGFNYVSVGRP